MTIIDHAAGLPDRAAGALRGAADAVQGVRHQAASDDLSPHPRDREEAARERWHAGQPARNAFERDVYRVHENRSLSTRRSPREVRSRIAGHAREIEAHGRSIGGGTVNAVTRWPGKPSGREVEQQPPQARPRW